MIAAIGKNGELGKNNDLIWRIKEDLQFFRTQTVGKKIVMGSNTFHSFPKPLPDRTHIVLTTQVADLGKDILVYHNLRDLLEYIKTLNEEVMIIGGASVYQSFINFANKMLLTIIDQSADADVYFPKFNENDWSITELSSHREELIPYKRLEYIRKIS